MLKIEIIEGAFCLFSVFWLRFQTFNRLNLQITNNTNVITSFVPRLLSEDNVFQISLHFSRKTCSLQSEVRLKINGAKPVVAA